jgi:hypothetical protein
MLIIPLARKLDWRRPPLITLLLILANLLIYAVSENRDQKSLERAVRYFLHSPLAQIEPALYIHYLHDERSLKEEQRLREALRQGEDGVVECSKPSRTIQTSSRSCMAAASSRRPIPVTPSGAALAANSIACGRTAWPSAMVSCPRTTPP